MVLDVCPPYPAEENQVREAVERSADVGRALQEGAHAR